MVRSPPAFNSLKAMSMPWLRSSLPFFAGCRKPKTIHNIGITQKREEKKTGWLRWRQRWGTGKRAGCVRMLFFLNLLRKKHAATATPGELAARSLASKSNKTCIDVPGCKSKSTSPFANETDNYSTLRFGVYCFWIITSQIVVWSLQCTPLYLRLWREKRLSITFRGC